MKDIEHKISLLLVPLVVFTSGEVTKAKLSQILSAFVCATILAATIALGISTYKFVNGADLSTFFYHQLANNIGMHAVYLSCYLAFSFFVVLHFFTNQRHNKHTTLIFLLIEAYIIILLILLSSKTILATLIVSIVVYVFITLDSGKKLWYGSVASVFIGIVLVVTLVNTPYTSTRFKQIVDTKFDVLNEEKFNYDTEFNGLSLRLLLWKFAFLINERENAHIFGVGTGDSKEKLNEIYREYNLYLGNTNNVGDTGYFNYNTHSQFVETYLKIGLAGLLFSIIYYVYLLYFSIKNKSPLFTTWLIIFIAFSITETTLEVNKGIAYFAFFNSVFIFYLRASGSATGEAIT
ncbi:O-antigen ligase family protein [Pontibacter sp. BT310]|uniref:O-antigen ligase family protein n=1 Tax=Pontibacter populi TaxID=890055 RepID=A0ABS6XCQ8_9BACT|nr:MULTISPECIES: O-antigen ligase family protein [Pontibacter]MBJ6118429.1 O-antigen ligase family protein [Pontibacter sp. BT310]MBR0570857.1 O-antigen ligase family protein [Microvirga sp. STS03]MBW3365283.1 O-antigen ligase family protein [Pontibacter populi]